MKSVLLAFCILPALAQAGEAGMPCKQYEYAQLKDSSKRELNDIYCAADSRVKWNSDSFYEMNKKADETLAGGQSATPLIAAMRDYSAAMQACQATAFAAWGMLEKKYKIKQPSCK